MMLAVRPSEFVEARWKGHGNERGHWRIICGACSAVLGYVDPLPLSWSAMGSFPEGLPEGEERPFDRSVEPRPGLRCNHEYEYHPDRDGYLHIRKPERFGAYGQPTPSRGGRRRYRHEKTDHSVYWERLSLAVGRYADGTASRFERELVERSVVGNVVLTESDREQLNELISELIRVPGGLLDSGIPINNLPLHADLEVGFTTTPVPCRVYCPRERGSSSRRPCGKLNTVRLPEFVTLTRFSRDGEWLVVLRSTDPILGGG